MNFLCGSIARALVVLAAFLGSFFVQAESKKEIEEVVVIGSRSQVPRSAAESTAPIDVFSSDEFSSIGNAADITDGLRATAPYYNASIASGDGDTFVRSTSIRGLAPDQTLLMVNGKRRHRAALIAEFVPAAGKGAHGPNIGVLPSIAVKNVEVLRDGAAAQYGSDAIAGVINLQMKDASEGGSVLVHHGQYYEGEVSTKFEGNIGLPLGEHGFVNISAEINGNEALSRGIQREEGAALIAAGVEGVGSDTPFDDDPLVQTWGRPESQDLRLFVNAGIDLSDAFQLYAQANLADLDGRYRFFYRRAEHPDGDFSAHATIATLREEGFEGLKAGFTPFFDGATSDSSLVGGIKGIHDSGWYFDVSAGFGRNEIDFTLNNTINQSLGLVGECPDSCNPPQMDFDVGKLGQEELSFNVDTSKQLRDDTHAALGVEWRGEAFTIYAGEPNSYQGAGSSGFKGFEPQNAGEFSRSNVAFYGELEVNHTDSWLMQWALRYENFDDFGDTTNVKLATYYSVNSELTIRGAISTGFHAPTPGQSNIQKVTTTFDANIGGQVEQGLVPPDHPLAIKAGGKELEEESSLNMSVGLTTEFHLFDSPSALTADIYNINIDGRIYKTQTLPVLIDAESDISTNISFYTNALDVQASGIDLVFIQPFDWMGGSMQTDLTFAMNYNSVNVVGQSSVRVVEEGSTKSVSPVPDADVEDIENSYPQFRFVITADTSVNPQTSVLVRANFYGAHYDERGRIDGVDGGPPTQEVGSTIYIDTEARYDFSDSLQITFGLMNAFDSYIDEVKAPYANRLNVGLPYPRRTAANFEGGSWYLKGKYSF